MVQIAVIGLGFMGLNHLRVLSILKDVELKFVFDIDPSRASAAAKAYGLPVSVDLERDLKNVEAVVIASPTVTHYDYVLKAAGCVRYIFVEKPLTDTLLGTEELRQYCNERGVCVQVGFIERFNPAVQQLIKILGTSAGVLNIDFTRTNRLSSRVKDVDVVKDLMIHDIDLALAINGPVAHVDAVGINEAGMVNFASAILTHRNRTFSRIVASRITEKKIRIVQATCSDMFVDCELLKKEIIVNRQSKVGETAGAYSIASRQDLVEVSPHEALLAELQTFVALCHGEKVGYPDASAAVEAMQVCELITENVLRQWNSEEVLTVR